MKLYHGSNTDIQQIDFVKSKPNKDFGRGFYLTADKHQAQQLAEQRALFFGGEQNKYRKQTKIRDAQ